MIKCFCCRCKIGEDDIGGTYHGHVYCVDCYDFEYLDDEDETNEDEEDEE